MPRIEIEWAMTAGRDWDDEASDAMADFAMNLLDGHDPVVSADLGYDPYADESRDRPQ